MIKLFSVVTTLDKFEGEENINITWLYKDRKKPIAPYEQIIRDYDPNSESNIYVELAVNELFTLEEAELLATDLSESQITNTKIIEVELPIEKNRAGLSAIPSGNLNGIVPMTPESLPFELYYYYDIRKFK